MQNYSEIAKALYNRGYEPIPIAPNKKYPTANGWTTMALPVEPWPKNHGIGLRTGKVTGIDLDILDNGIVSFLLDSIEFDFITRTGKPPKTLIPVICDKVTEKIVSDRYVDGNGKVNAIELLSYGQQFVAYGIHPGTKRPYEWSSDLISHDIPTVKLSFILYLFDVFYELTCKRGWKNISRKVRQYEKSKRQTGGDRIGDLYNEFYPIEDVLQEYGWKHCHGKNWTRPDKKHGVSGSVLDGQFYCFTSSTCLEPDRTYDSFGLLTYYEFNGDFSASAKAVLQSMNEAA